MSISTDFFDVDADIDASGYHAEQALARDKRESLDLAVKGRWAALAVIAIMLPFINPHRLRY